MVVHEKTTGCKGFTLVELLVVIAMIAILAAILLPVFADAPGKPGQRVCLNNIKQLALATLMYIGDHDGYFPFWSGDLSTYWSETDPDIESGLLPYVNGSWDVFKCPNDRNTPKYEHWHLCSYGFVEKPSVSVADDPQGCFGRVANLTQVNPAISIDNVSNPAYTIVIKEHPIGQAVECVAPKDIHQADDETARGFFSPMNFPHQDGTMGHFGFADGHAKALAASLRCTGMDPGNDTLFAELERTYGFFCGGPVKPGETYYIYDDDAVPYSSTW